MLSNTEFELWCHHRNLTEEAKALISTIRDSPPSRRVGSYKGNVSCRFPSRKMGVTIQGESHKVELAFIHEYEYDDDVLEYYDQPPAIKLNYEAKNGRRLGVMHTPDFFVIRALLAGYEEHKTEEGLIVLSAKSPNRYQRDAEGLWRCIPGEALAEQFGLYYRLRSSKEINWTFQRNVEFLDDYFRADSPNVKAEARTFLFEQVAKEPGITLGALFRLMTNIATRDDVFMLIAHEELYVNLHAVPLVESENVRVFPNRDTAIAYESLIHSSAQSRANIEKIIEVAIGNVIHLNGSAWRIALLDERSVGLVGEDATYTELPAAAFEKLIKEGRVTNVTTDSPSGIHPEAMKRLMQADKTAYGTANFRLQIVRAHMFNEPLPAGIHVPERTARYWAAQYRKGQTAFGNGYVELLPRNRAGNSGDKLPVPTRKLLNEFILNDYETIKQKLKREVYGAYKLACGRRGITPASYKTFCKAVKFRPRHEQTRKRQGSKAAYKYEGFYWELELTTPRHGERPFHIAHIDHTKLDVELVHSLTGRNLGRAWATFMTDAYTRRLLAVYVTFDPPSYRSCMMVARICVRRFGRLPQINIVDGGLELSGTYFETLLAAYECGKKERPSTKSRFGAVCERLFGTSNTQFIHNLQGNTQIMRNVRQVTKAISPKEHAIWTLEKLYLRLCEWAYEVYDTTEHPALGESPRDAFARGMIVAGERKHKLISYNNDFRMLALPTTRKETAKVQPGCGVKINRIYYWSDVFRNPKIEGGQIPVRFDPFNAGHSFAFALGQWQECYSQYYSVFRNRSERELMLATAELRRRQTLHSRESDITALKLAQFLESVEAEEVLLRQRRADHEQRGILSLIDGDMDNRKEIASFTDATADSVQDASSLQSPPKASNKIIVPELYEEF
jgi:putative transposase